MKQLYVNDHAVYSHVVFRCAECSELVIASASHSDGVRCPLCGANVVPVGNAVMASVGGKSKTADLSVNISIDGVEDVAAALQTVDRLEWAARRAAKRVKRLQVELKHLAIPPVEKNAD